MSGDRGHMKLLLPVTYRFSNRGQGRATRVWKYARR